MREVLEQIMLECKSHQHNDCQKCKWFSQEEKDCMFFDAPEYWDLEEILKRGEGINE